MTTGPTRRDALRLIGAGVTALSAPVAGAKWMPELVSPRATFFPLADVRLGEGPFLAAQRLDAAYLLRLEPDRMLANFRVNAGLAPKAPVYGGWESQQPWIDIRCHGHTLGHYLTACACMYASTDDVRFAERVDYIVSELATCQQKTGGWLTAFPDGVAPLTDSLAGRDFAGVPWYTTHKILAGLRDAHLIRGNQPALDVLVNFASWIDTACAGVPLEQFQKMLDREHGGMNEVLGDVSAITGQVRFRELGQRFSHNALLMQLSAKRDRLDGLHANTQIPKVIGFSRLYELGGPDHYSDAAQFFWNEVVTTRSFTTGGHGDVEHFFPTTEFEKHLGSAKTMETCCTHNMLRLTRSLYARDARAVYFDYFERALFNGILASQDPETGMNTYFQATRPGYVRLYHTPFDSFWCCTGSGIENHARYAESIYAHQGDTLYVNLFLASQLNWRERGITVTQATRFPDEDTTRLTFDAPARRRVALWLRQPSWCPVMTLTINGRHRKTGRRPGGYVVLEREFRPGDVIEVRIPMTLATDGLPGSQDYAALRFGPIVLAGRLGTTGLATGNQLIVNERESGQMLNEPVDIPTWPRPFSELPQAIERLPGAQLAFVGRGFSGAGRIELIPWFRATHERYNLYWRRTA